MALGLINKVVRFVLAAMLEGIPLPSNMAAKTIFCLYLVKRLIVCYAQMCCKRYHIVFSTFSLMFKCKICVQKEVIHNFKNHLFVMWPAMNLLILRKWCRFGKQITIILRYDPLIIFWRQNHITFIFIKTLLQDLLVQNVIMAYFPTKGEEIESTT